MLSELLFSLLGSFFKLRENTHISKNFLRILLLGATLSTKIFHEYGPRLFVVIKSLIRNDLFFSEQMFKNANLMELHLVSTAILD